MNESTTTRLVCILYTFALVAVLGCVGPVTAKQPTAWGDDHCDGYRHCKTAKHTSVFNRIAVFPVYLNTDIDNESVAEIVDVSKNGNTLVYTDGVAGNLGFIDIKNPARPKAAGVVSMGGEPTSVAVVGGYALVAASEEDSRDDKVRSVVNIYQLQEVGTAKYPTIVSASRSAGTPIPWGALSGLEADDASTVYSIHDSFYDKSRIYVMDVSSTPAVISDEIVLKDSRGKLAHVDADRVNEDGTVLLDPEGIAVRADGGFWIASEGAGTVGDPEQPLESLNLILEVSKDGVIDELIELPETTNPTSRIRLNEQAK